jgi:hypothetical protein
LPPVSSGKRSLPAFQGFLGRRGIPRSVARGKVGAMTGRQMCEEVVRYRNPEISADEVAEKAREAWYASRDGSLAGVFGAYQDMCVEQIAKGERPDDPEPSSPAPGDLRRRKVDGGVETLCFDGNRWFSQGIWPC